jgi:hypothetical protein
VINFGDFRGFVLPEEAESLKLSQNIRSAKFRFPFYILFSNRKMLVFAEDIFQRDMWLKAFKFVTLACTEIQRGVSILDHKVKKKSDKTMKK